MIRTSKALVARLRKNGASYLMVTHGNGQRIVVYQLMPTGETVQARAVEGLVNTPMPLLQSNNDGLFTETPQTYVLADLTG